MRACRVKEFLDTNHVNYSTISHPTSYTAQGTAATAHVSGNELAKTIIVNLDGQLAMAVLPASAQLDLVAFKKLARVTRPLSPASLSSTISFLTANWVPCRPSAIFTTSRCTLTRGFLKTGKLPSTPGRTMNSSS